MTKYLVPPLTTVHVPVDFMAETAVGLLSRTDQYKQRDQHACFRSCKTDYQRKRKYEKGLKTVYENT